jgi:antitoxin component YwqK of YwqJK toxin-antitoxin module
MEFKVENGTNFISIGYSSIGSYLKIKKPVSLIWYDCRGSIGQYLCMMPSTEITRKKLHSSITNSLYEEFTGRIDELYLNLLPLFSLFENGDYQLWYSDGSKRPIATKSSGTYELGWFIEYPKVVDLSRIWNLRTIRKMTGMLGGAKSFQDDLLTFTSSWIYDTWENNMYIATRPLSEIDAGRVKFFEERILAGDRPFVILISAFYQPEHNYSNDFVLDGHHKLQAYKNLGIDPPRATIVRMFSEPNEREFDLETLAEQLYPWQIKHILNNWDQEDGDISNTTSNVDCQLHRFDKNGPVKEYYENEKIKSEAFYINDKVDGKLSDWYDNGQLKHEEYYINGNRTGIWKEWYSSGHIKSTYGYDDSGQIHGKFITYFEDGSQRSEYLFENGQYADGYGFSKWWHTHNMEYEFWYKNGIVVKKISYSDDGRIVSSEYYDAAQSRLVGEPKPISARYKEHETFSSDDPKKDLNVIREREYPETNYSSIWKIIALTLLILIQLLRMCK